MGSRDGSVHARTFRSAISGNSRVAFIRVRLVRRRVHKGGGILAEGRKGRGTHGAMSLQARGGMRTDGAFERELAASLALAGGWVWPDASTFCGEEAFMGPRCLGDLHVRCRGGL